MIRMIKDWALALAILGVVVVVGGWMQGHPQLPEQAPQVRVTLIDGQVFDLSAQRGHPVVLNFWAEWCPPCKAEIPEFSRFAKEHPDVSVVGIAVDSGNAAQVSRAARQLGISYPVAVADDAVLMAYDISSLPTTVVIDADGSVAAAHVGRMSYSQLQAAVF